MVDCLATYEPVDVLKPVTENVWIVDGPVVRMKYPWIGLFSLPFSTRMTVIRLGDGRLWLHSPTAADPALVEDVAALGEAARRFPEGAVTLGGDAPAEWRGEVEQVALSGRFMTEIVFRHCLSDTVIVTDLIENFERDKVRCHGLWWLMKLGGAAKAERRPTTCARPSAAAIRRFAAPRGGSPAGSPTASSSPMAAGSRRMPRPGCAPR